MLRCMRKQGERGARNSVWHYHTDGTSEKVLSVLAVLAVLADELLRELESADRG